MVDRNRPCGVSFLQDASARSRYTAGMDAIFQTALPPEMTLPRPLPGVAPCGARDWLRVDEVYAAQMALRMQLLAGRRDSVLWCAPEALDAAREVLQAALAVLPGLGFAVSADQVCCPDGRVVPLDWDAPLLVLGHLVQEDICLLQKRGEEHVLTGAVLCFPAGWRLSEKAGRPLSDIHVPVPEYDGQMATRVQRLFDGVQVGKPLWRFNVLPYPEADLHHPARRNTDAVRRFTRSERQCILRLAATQAVVFTIHTYVLDDAGEGPPAS